MWISVMISVVNLALSMGVFSFFIINKLPYKIFDSLWFRLGIIIFVTGISFWVIHFFKEKLKCFWLRNFRKIVYFSCIIFAFIHIFNFPLDLKTILLMPLLTFPQLFGAFVFSFVRIKYGFFYQCRFSHY